MRIELMRRTARSLELVDLIAERSRFRLQRRWPPGYRFTLEADNVLAFKLALSELRHELERMERALLDVPTARVLDEEVRSTR